MSLYSITVKERDGVMFKLVETEFESVFSECLGRCYRDGGRFAEREFEVFDVVRVDFNGVEMSWEQFTSVIAMRGITWDKLTS